MNSGLTNVLSSIPDAVEGLLDWALSVLFISLQK